MNYSLEQLVLIESAALRQRAADTIDQANAVRSAFGADRGEFKKFISHLARLASYEQ